MAASPAKGQELPPPSVFSSNGSGPGGRGGSLPSVSERVGDVASSRIGADHAPPRDGAVPIPTGNFVTRYGKTFKQIAPAKSYSGTAHAIGRFFAAIPGCVGGLALGAAHGLATLNSDNYANRAENGQYWREYCDYVWNGEGPERLEEVDLSNPPLPLTGEELHRLKPAPAHLHQERVNLHRQVKAYEAGQTERDAETITKTPATKYTYNGKEYAYHLLSDGRVFIQRPGDAAKDLMVSFCDDHGQPLSAETLKGLVEQYIRACAENQSVRKATRLFLDPHKKQMWTYPPSTDFSMLKGAVSSPEKNGATVVDFKDKKKTVWEGSPPPKPAKKPTDSAPPPSRGRARLATGSSARRHQPPSSTGRPTTTRRSRQPTNTTLSAADLEREQREAAAVREQVAEENRQRSSATPSNAAPAALPSSIPSLPIPIHTPPPQ